MMRPKRILPPSMGIMGIVHGHITVTVTHVRASHRRHGIGTGRRGRGSSAERSASVVVVFVGARRGGRRRGLLEMGLGLRRVVARGHGLLVRDGAIVTTRSASRVGVVLPLGVHDGLRVRDRELRLLPAMDRAAV